MQDKRWCGVLLHPTSLPGPYGIGEIGPQARAFADELQSMGQHYWQVLPMGPTSFGNSPYQSPSTFASNHLLISFDDLLEEGLLQTPDIASFPACSDTTIDYGTVIPARMAVLAAVCRSFELRASRQHKEDFARFCECEAEWLEDYALFMAIKRAYGGGPWTDWPRELRGRDEDAIARARVCYAENIREEKLLQFLFDRQWQHLVATCHER